MVVPKMTALVGVLIEYSILFGQMFSTDCNKISHPSFFFLYPTQHTANGISGISYHRMRQLQRTRLQRTNDAQRPPHNDILCILASDLGLEAIRHVGIRQPLDALRQRPIEHHIERIFVVPSTQGLRLGLAWFTESPGFFVKGFLAPILATSASGRRGEVPASRYQYESGPRRPAIKKKVEKDLPDTRNARQM